MQKFGLIKPAKSTKRAVLGAGAFSAENEEEVEDATNLRGKNAIAAANRALTSYVAASALTAAIDVDASVYDYDGAMEKRDELKKTSVATGSSSSRSITSYGADMSSAVTDVPPASSYIGGLLKTAQRRDKEREIVHEKKLLKERQAEDALYGDLPKFVTSAYKAKLEEDEAFAKESDLQDASAADVTTSGMSGFYRGVMQSAKGIAVTTAGLSSTHTQEPQELQVQQQEVKKRVSRFVDSAEEDKETSPALLSAHAHGAHVSTASTARNSVERPASPISATLSGAHQQAILDKEIIEAARALRMTEVGAARQRYYLRQEQAKSLAQ